MLGENAASAFQNFNQAGPIHTYGQSQPLYGKVQHYIKKQI